MPQIGWFEILLIVVVAIVVVGPKDFPIMLKKVGSWIRSIKGYFNTLQEEVSHYKIENFEENHKKKEINKTDEDGK